MKYGLLAVMMITLSISMIGCASAERGGRPAEAALADAQTVLQTTDAAIAAGDLQTDNTAVNEEMSSSTTENIQTGNADELDKKAVTDLVGEFGQKLKMVSLLAPKEIVVDSMKENYGGLVSPELLALWQKNPQNAPGRMVSSPWPERIDILSADKKPDLTYEVKGNIIEITSSEAEHGGVAAKRPITLTVQKTDGHWLITDVTLGSYADSDPILYKNPQYGFSFSLPTSWKGYTTLTEKWEGQAIDTGKGEKTVETGPILNIRHPLWTSKNPRQDIPIMVFTQDQWNSLQKDEFHIGAAPVGPTELGRNSLYVFALPARYNFAFPTGYEEVEDILAGSPLKPEAK